MDLELRVGLICAGEAINIQKPDRVEISGKKKRLEEKHHNPSPGRERGGCSGREEFPVLPVHSAPDYVGALELSVFGFSFIDIMSTHWSL
jgi:hypothetical protein